MKYKAKIKTKNLLSWLLLFNLYASNYVYSWDSHFILTYGALKNWGKISNEANIPAETLEQFLLKERQGLIQVLAKHEEWLGTHLENYPTLPSYLRFKEHHEKTPIQDQFLQAIRVNPEMKFPLYVQSRPGTERPLTKSTLSMDQVVLPELLLANSSINFAKLTIEGVSSGELLSAIEIVSTASDEPDYGMDMNLWENNNSWFGKIYGLGEQSFGSNTIVFSSQVPFHMAFYYESNIIYKFASYLKRTHVEYRIHQYLNLSRFAFATGHKYWGYRFLGWALHYAQDLTQPYHSSLSPNDSTAKLLYVNAIKFLGIKTPELKLVQILTNRHSSFENYEYYFLKNIIEKKEEQNPILKALGDFGHDKKYPLYSANYPREIIAKESNQLSLSTDAIIKDAFPEKYVSDPDYIFYETESAVNLFKSVQDSEHLQLLNERLNELLRNLGAHTRKMTEYATELS